MDKCIGCSLFMRKCPAEAITGVVKQPFSINLGKCIRCGLCAELCRKDEVDVRFA